MNPWFSELWYVSTYPDVAEAGVDPFTHYRHTGWKEGRDPSGLFSTNWYLKRNPDVVALGVNPLDHYVDVGRSQSRAPHPALGPVDHARRRVAIIVVSFDAPDVVQVLLESLVSARNDVLSSIFLVENGSADEHKAAVLAHADRYRDLLDLRLIDSADNLGFSGGNNLGIKAALCEDFTHICLLNSDVVCTSGWMDDLLAAGCPVISPVSNAVGNEQTVPIDYEADITFDTIAKADAFARRRRDSFGAALERSDFLGFFCVMLERSAVEKVGLLDEQFFPGSYEDDDYCLRLLNAGHELIIARHVFLHHFGSASFGRLAWDDRVAAGSVNRRRFEVKWGRSWCDRTHLPALSGVQDARHYAPQNGRDALLAATLAVQARAQADLVQQLVSAVHHLRTVAEEASRAHAASSPLDSAMAGAALPLQRVLFGDKAVPLGDEPDGRFLAAYWSLVEAAWARLEHREFISVNVLAQLQPFLFAFARLCEDADPVLMLTQHADPITSDEKDGYVQRVRAVDGLLAGRARIYIHFHEHCRGNPNLVELATDIWRLEIGDNDPLAEALVSSLLDQGLNLYCHSILPLESRTARWMLAARQRQLVIDVHGSVPEEFAMHGDGFGAQVFGEHEKEAFTSADALVVVSKNMAAHLSRKYGISDERFVVCPIFVEGADRTDRRSYFDRPRVIYAGGTQEWQQIGKMVDLVDADRGRSDFLILTPAVAEMMRRFERDGAASPRDNIVIRSASHAEVLATYPKYDFGILLRKDSTVNRVACPTKLIEYMSFGVIPILDTVHVGDFVGMGMKYVPVDEYADGIIPDPGERKKMAAANYRVLGKLKREMEAGSARIRAIVTAEHLDVVPA